MKKTWRKLPAFLCVMTLALTGRSVLSLAEEVPAENFAAGEQFISETGAAAPVATEETQPAPEPAAVPVYAEEPAVPSDLINVDVTLSPAETIPAEGPQPEETPATEDTVIEESSVTEAPEEIQNDEANNEVTAVTSASPEVSPVAEETVVVEEIPAQELIPADMTVETLTEAYGVVTADRPCVIRLISSMAGKIKITAVAGSPLYVQFGNEAGEIISEHYPEEEGNVTFSFRAEAGESVLLYIWSIGVNEDGTMIEYVPFHISSEKTEPAQEEMLDVYVEQEGIISTGESGKTEEAVRAAEEAEDAAETSEAVRVRRVVLSGRDGSSFKEGETVHLSVSLEGFEDFNEFMIIWEVNQGEGWKEVSRGANNFYSFPASAESLNAEYRVRVLFR